MTTDGNDQGTYPDTLESAAVILEKRALKQPPGLLTRLACRTLRREAARVTAENRFFEGWLRG